MLVTTSRMNTRLEREQARELAVQLNVPCVARQQQSLTALLMAEAATQGLVVVRGGLQLVHVNGKQLAFHPNSARLRVRQLRRRGSDPFVRYLGLQPGESFLDTTLGLAGDAIVASYLVHTKVAGCGGQVVGWEKNRLLSMLVKAGLQTYENPDATLVRAMRGIIVRCCDYRQQLLQCPAYSFDVVYFDPMFPRPCMQSQTMQQLRSFADPSPLSQEMISHAARVARRLVVLKAPASFPFMEWGFSSSYRMGRHAYGLLRVMR